MLCLSSKLTALFPIWSVTLLSLGTMSVIYFVCQSLLSFCDHATQKKEKQPVWPSLTVMMLFPIHSPCTHTLTICAILHHNPKVLRYYKPEWLLIKATCRNSAYRLLIVFVFLRTCTVCLTML